MWGLEGNATFTRYDLYLKVYLDETKYLMDLLSGKIKIEEVLAHEWMPQNQFETWKLELKYIEEKS